jgi:hypothetical protein
VSASAAGVLGRGRQRFACHLACPCVMLRTPFPLLWNLLWNTLPFYLGPLAPP